MSSKAYHDELNYLRTLGLEYAQRHPSTAGALGSGARDPDVERLLQGFSFLTARIHDRLDNQYSHIAEALLEVAWPQVLQPLPSTTMIQFQPDRQVLRKNFEITQGTELDSENQPWGNYRFQTSRTVHLYPFQINNIELVEKNDTAFLEISFEMNSGASLEDCQFSDLPLFISGDDERFTYGWYLWLTQYIKRAYFVADGDDKKIAVNMVPVGFDDDTTLFPDSDAELPGHRLLREFFCYPKNFLFINIPDLTPLSELGAAEQFKLVVDFGNRSPSGPMRKLSPNALNLFCTPAVNLFNSHARIALDHTRSEFVVRSDEIDIEHHEVFSVEKIIGVESGPSGKRREFLPFFKRDIGTSHDSPTYRTRFTDIQVRRNDRALQGRECFVSFENLNLDVSHSLSLDVTCVNRSGASSLKPGQVCKPTEMVPAFVQFKNIDQPTNYRPAVTAPDYLWQLVSSMNLARQSIANLENLRSAIRLHCRVHRESDAAVNQWLEGISSINVNPGVCTDNGTILRTLHTELELHSPPERTNEYYLFAIIICEFMRHVASINTRLDFRLKFTHDVALDYQWPKRVGTCPVL
ncbi:MAG: type VI secretion system baseplate subunit TssF [bacterium]|nr:type VI secretion system baseplate subunit TssF [bacterium]